MEYFWKQYSSLPEGVGYERFSAPHIITLAVLAILIVLAVRQFAKAGQARQKKILTVVPFVMLVLECGKDAFLVSVGSFGVGYLPLHLCSLGVFVFLLSVFSRTGRWKMIFSEISLTLILPGSVAALLFPDWVHLYPVFNFMNLYGFVWHGLLVLYPLLMQRAGMSCLSARHMHYDIVFLACVVPPVWIFDRVFGCNYMFVNWPPRGTPLAWIASVTGQSWYLLGYAVFSIAVIAVIYLVISIVKGMRNESNTDTGK